MPGYRRVRRPGGTVFLTLALARRRDDLLVREIEALRRATALTRASRPFVIDAAVVLPDHLHMVWTLPPGDADYSTRIAALKARFTRAARRAGACPAGVSPSKARKGEAGVWQRRFRERTIRDEADYRAHVEYCWINPVKHGLVARPVDWPHSSIHRDLRLGRVPPEWAM